MSFPEVKLGRELGAGSYAQVYEAQVNGTHVALKLYKDGFEEKLASEIAIFTLLGDHPHILEHGARIDPTVSAIVKMPRRSGLTLKYYEMTLRGYIRQNNEPIVPKTIYSYASQLLSAILHCHSLNIAHNDISPSNILVNTEGKLVLADFNHSKVNKVTCGSFWYMAPETLFFEEYQRRKYCQTIPFGANDIWSVGVVLAEIVNREILFLGQCNQDMMGLICQEIGPPTEENFPKYFKSKFWNGRFSSLRRRKIEDIIDHDGLEPWFYDLCGGLLAYPLERISAPEALALIPKSVIVQF